jgi:hypothetical protein
MDKGRSGIKKKKSAWAKQILDRLKHLSEIISTSGDIESGRKIGGI